MSPHNKRSTGLNARARAHTILHEVVDRHRPLDDVLHSDKKLAKLSPRDRAFARNRAATTRRRMGQIDMIIDDCLDRPLPPSAAAARNALRLGICQILFLNTQTHAAVDTSVTLAGQRGPDRFRGLVNGVLRRVVRTAGDMHLSPDAERANTPSWLRNSWTESFGEQVAAGIARAHLQPPTVDLTVPADRETWSVMLGGNVIGKPLYASLAAATLCLCLVLPKVPGGCRMQQPRFPHSCFRNLWVMPGWPTCVLHPVERPPSSPRLDTMLLR